MVNFNLNIDFNWMVEVGTLGVGSVRLRGQAGTGSTSSSVREHRAVCKQVDLTEAKEAAIDVAKYWADKI